MSKTVELLKQAASMEKKAYTEYVTSFTSAGIATLVKGGVSFEKAAELIKAACEQDSKALQLSTGHVAFEKAAEYIEQLEVKVGDLEKSAEKAEEVKESEPMNKLASIGFTKEELEMMAQLPENLMTKVASAATEPWNMGSGAGVPREKTDALLEFILS